MIPKNSQEGLAPGWTPADDDSSREHLAESIWLDATTDLEASVPSLPSWTTPRFRSGEILLDRYRILHLVGQGGMGEVYRAEDCKLDQTVALKCLSRLLLGDPKKQEGLLREVKTARKITHPNVCRIYDLHVTDDLTFLSMEFIEGEDLASLLRRIGRLPKRKAVDLGQQICLGLEAVHSQGIVHRDLKPANVMIDQRGDALLTDFGLATESDRVLRSQIRQGTPSYMAPEQRAGLEVSPKSDLYALGQILYTLFTNQRALRPASVDAAHEPQELIPPSVWLPDLDPSLESIILQCLATSPDDRPTAREVAETLASSQTKPHPQTALKVFLSCRITGHPKAQAWQHLITHLAERHGGRVFDPNGHKILFDSSARAVAYALDLQRSTQKPSLQNGGPIAARIGLHLGEFHPVGNAPETKEGHTQPTLRIAELLSDLAGEHQTLLSRGLFDLARASHIPKAEQLHWLAHGGYELAGFHETVEICEVGQKDNAPFRAPEDRPEARKQLVQKVISGWRPAPDLSLPNRRHWMIDRKLSEGGFGEVWLARHNKTDEKRIFKFCYDPTSLRSLQREITLFRLLKETLGERRDIARILDWNFDRAPFFIEGEYSEGGSLLDWAKKKGGLPSIPLETRLDLLIQVATALAAAHSIGVLHKDVKPANILILDAEDKPQAQLSDFGIGHVIERQSLIDAGITAQGLTLADLNADSATGTRLYLAPELLQGRPASVQADIYALGVMLYQLTVGDFSRVLAPGWERDIEHELLKEDIAAAVDGSPEKRLPSAAMLADRLSRLETRRIGRRDRKRQQEEAQDAQKALTQVRKRRRLAVAAMILMAVFAGMFFVQSQRISKEAEALRQVTIFLKDLFKFSEPEIAFGKEITARQMLDEGSMKIGLLDDQPEVQAELMNTIGQVYASLGDFEKAEDQLGKALALRLSHLGKAHPKTAEVQLSLARLALSRGDLQGSEGLTQDALETVKNAWSSPTVLRVKGNRLLGEIALARKDYLLAEELFKRALELLQKSQQPDTSEKPELLFLLAESIHHQDRFLEAQEYYHQSVEALPPGLTESSLSTARALSGISRSQVAHGEFAESAETLRRAIAIEEEVLGKGHPSTFANLNDMAITLATLNQHQEAIQVLSEVLDGLPQENLIQRAETLQSLGQVLQDGGNFEEAEERFIQSLEMARQEGLDNTPLAATNYSHLGYIHLNTGQPELAQPFLEKCYRIREASLGLENLNTAACLNGLARVLQAQGKRAEAEEHFLLSLNIRREVLPGKHSKIASALYSLAEFYLEDGQTETAKPLLEEALGICELQLLEAHWLTGIVKGAYGHMLALERQDELAMKFLEEAHKILLPTRGQDDIHTQRVAQRIERLRQNNLEVQKGITDKL